MSQSAYDLLQNLRENEERLRLAMDAAAMGAWDWDFATGKVHWSGNEERLFGLQPGSFNGTFDAFLARVHPDDMTTIQARMAGALADRRAEHRDEFRIVHADGSIRWMLASGRIYYGADGQPTRMIGINMDVTDRKRAEEAVRESQKLVAAAGLAAMMAHEINNPLASLTNALFLIDKHAQVDDGARAYLRIAREELARVAHIVKQTLNFHDKSERPIAISLVDLVENVVALYERQLPPGVRLARRFQGEYASKGYAPELRQLVTNLLANAVEAVGENGTITIHVFPARQWHGDHAQPGTHIVVADSGCGIAKADLPHIFEPFFTTKGAKGGGLGLWVTASIVEKHGGNIRVRSSCEPRHQGTTISVFLPADGAANFKKTPNEARARQLELRLKRS